MSERVSDWREIEGGEAGRQAGREGRKEGESISEHVSMCSE